MPPNALIVFGYDELLLTTLDVVQAAGLAVRAVVFPANRLDRPHVSHIKSLVEQRELLTLVQPQRRDAPRFTAELKLLRPDLMLVWSYSMILPEAVVAVPRLGAVNLHMGLLPAYRGAHAMAWALVNGEHHTGVTLHYMDKGVDSGPIIDQARFPIHGEDDMVSLLIRGKTAGKMLLEHWLPRLIVGRVAARPQDETQAHWYRPRDEADACIQWSADGVAIWNLVRSLVPPFSGAFTTCGSRPVVIRKVRVVECRERFEPGTVYDVSAQDIYVAAGREAVVIEAMQIGNDQYVAGELANTGIRVGDRLGTAPPGAGASEAGTRANGAGCECLERPPAESPYPFLSKRT